MVCNPSKDIEWDNSTKMEPYFETVKNSDIVVASEFKNHIGKGVFDEIKSALYHKIEVFCLRKNLFRFRLLQVKNVELVDVTNWKIRYGKIRLMT